MTINVEGQTTVEFYATNNNAVSEAARGVTVSLDKTLPAIVYAGNQGSYRVLDTVNITCTASDSLSGLLFDTCVDISGPAYSSPSRGIRSPRRRWTSPAISLWRRRVSRSWSPIRICAR